MPTLGSLQIPPPANWQDFETLCRDLWRELWSDPNVQMNGRQGQPQHGVDVFGRPGEGTEWGGVQCKLKSQIAGTRLTPSQIEAEVTKAHKFVPPLASFTIATTAEQDADAQEAARVITQAQLAAGSFPVTVRAWDEIVQDLASYPRLLDKHYPQLGLGAGSAARDKYLRAVWSKLLPLPLMGLGGSHRDDIPLSAVYTALDVTGEGRAGGPGPGVEPDDSEHRSGVSVDLRGEANYLERLRSRIAAEAEAARRDEERRPRAEPELYSRRLTAVEAAAAAPRLVMLGPAGSGKSSFARHLALCLAGEALGHDEANLRKLNRVTEDAEADLLPWPHRAPLPIFVELRKLVRSSAFNVAAEPGVREILAYLSGRFPELEKLAPEALRDRGGALLFLDGLDETPAQASSRERLKAAIGDLVRAYPECRVLVTSRPYAYAEGSPWRLEGLGFEAANLAPLSAPQSQAFIAGWYSQLAERSQVDAERAGERSAELWRQISTTPYLKPLAELPLMLTMMTDLHASGGGRLRGGRAGIYESSVELLLDRWNEVRDVPEGGTVSEQLGMNVDEIRRALERLAFDVHRDRGSANGDLPAEITDTELWQALDRERSHERLVDERRVMDYLHQRSGIILGESRNRYRFPHRSYQEYLAAGHLIRTGFPGLVAEVVAENAGLWREVVQLAAGQLVATPFMLWSLLGTLVPEPPPETPSADDPGFERAFYAALAVRETGIWRRAAGEEEKLERIRRWLEKCVEVGALPPPDRAEAGRVLGLLGDKRRGIDLTQDGVPEIDWVEVPAGAFRMGSSEDDKEAFEWEKPQHPVDLETFSIARYPITNAQYAAFVKDGGYAEEQRDCWTEAGWEWKEQREGPERLDIRCLHQLLQPLPAVGQVPAGQPRDVPAFLRRKPPSFPRSDRRGRRDVHLPRTALRRAVAAAGSVVAVAGRGSEARLIGRLLVRQPQSQSFVSSRGGSVPSSNRIPSVRSHIRLMETENDVGLGDACFFELAGNAVLGSVTVDPDLAVDDIDVYQGTVDPSRPFPTDHHDDVPVVLLVDDHLFLDGSDCIVGHHVAGEHLTDSLSVATQGIHRRISSCTWSRTP